VRLSEQVKRNQARFPEDFVFRLTTQEKAEVVANCDHLNRLRFSPALPYAFTEHGTIMAAAVLNSARAIEVSVYVVRAFVKLRELLATHKELAKRLDELEARIEKKLAAHDQAIGGILDAIRELMKPAELPKKRRIGFVQDE
jgi:phage regulator Rha-like protein